MTALSLAHYFRLDRLPEDCGKFEKVAESDSSVTVQVESGVEVATLLADEDTFAILGFNLLSHRIDPSFPQFYIGRFAFENSNPEKVEDRVFAAQIVAPRLARLVDVDEPKLSTDGQVKIKMERGCLCGSDSPLWDYDLNQVMDEAKRTPDKRKAIPFVDFEGDPYPMRVGQSIHECLGTVVESRSPRFKEGDFVLALPNAQDGLVEYMVADADRAIHLIEDVVPKEEILMTQPLGTVVWACQKLGNLLDKDIVVAGQGPMGLLFSHLLANLGARTVIALDRLDYRLEAAERMYATHTINVDEQDPIEAIREITNGRMADICVEVVGHQMATINTCMDYVRRMGTLLCFGVPDNVHYEGFSYQKFFRQNLSLIASVGPDVVPNFCLARDLIAQGRIDVSPIVTHTIQFSEIQKGFELFVNREDGAIKVVLDYENSGV